MQFAKRLDTVETSAIRELFKLLAKPGIISFAGGFPDATMFDVEGIRLATEQALSDTQVGAVLQYGATEGHPPLREAISGYMLGKGVKVAPDGLITTTGSQQALDLIGKVMISQGDKVIVEAPTFLATIQCFRLYGAELVNAPIDANGVDLERLEALIVAHKPKLIYLIPNFGNPSGAMLAHARRLRILELAVKHHVLVVEDDPYGDLYFDAPPPPSLLALSEQVLGSRDWLAYAGSFSKVLSPGLRVGWLIAPTELLAKATMCKQFSDAHTSNLTQAIAANYLQAGRMPSCVNHVRNVYAKRAQAMARGLREKVGESIAFETPKGGMFFWARLTGEGGKSTDVAALAERAIANNVAFVPGAPFYAHDPDRTTLRFSFATAKEDKISEGLDRLAQVI